MAFYIEWLQKPLTTMFPVTETQSSTRPQRLLNVLPGLDVATPGVANAT